MARVWSVGETNMNRWIERESKAIATRRTSSGPFWPSARAVAVAAWNPLMVSGSSPCNWASGSHSRRM